MKHFDDIKSGNILLYIVPALLIIPNIYTSILGEVGFAETVMSILLPLGVYLLVQSVFKKTPLVSLLLFPVMFLASFQIVVSSLYNDSSAIGVDMFLNVRTTNSMEVKELLSSLVIPVIIVMVIYIPAIVFSAIALRHKDYASPAMRKRAAVAGAGCLIVGTGCGIYVRHQSPDYSITADLFPVNAVYNLAEAIERGQKTARYETTSESFTYNAKSTRGDDPELYIAVIGETSRADDWQLAGYDRPTNPLLSCYGDSLVVFDKVLSESNTTHKSVPMLLTTLSSENYDKGIYEHKSIITAFKEAGFHTAYLSTQRPNHSFIEQHSREADTVRYLTEKNKQICPDEEVLRHVRSLVDSKKYKKLLIVVHMYGSHYNYRDRYPAGHAVFTPDECGQAKCENRSHLVNAYDNTIVYTDSVLHELCDITKNAGIKGGLIYTSDHGEDIFDDSRHKFLHASPKPTYWQLHVPLLVFLNSEYNRSYPDVKINADRNRHKMVSSSKSYSQTLLQIAGIDTDYSIPSQSLVSDSYAAPGRPLFLNDRDESIDLMQRGFDPIDRTNYLKLKQESK